MTTKEKITSLIESAKKAASKKEMCRLYMEATRLHADLATGKK